MRRHCLSLFTLLALLGLLAVVVADLGHGHADEDEDYYMQELLTRERYNQVQGPDEPVASIADRQEHPGQTSAKKGPKGKADSSRHVDKSASDTKSGKISVTR